MSKKSNQSNNQKNEMEVPMTPFLQPDEFVRDIEIDGAAFVSATKNGQQDFSIEIEDQALSFKAPCIILIKLLF